MVPSPLLQDRGSVQARWSQDGSLGTDEHRLTVHFKPATAALVFLPSGEFQPNDTVVPSSGGKDPVLLRSGITDGG